MPALVLSLLCFLSSASAAFTTERFVLTSAASSTFSPIPVAQHTLNLTAKTPRSARKHAALSAIVPRLATLSGGGGDLDYLVGISIGGQEFNVVLDTGSSDLWVPVQGFKCFNTTGAPEPTSVCDFGTTGFNKSQSKTFTPYANHNFNISYLSGEFLTGAAGFDNITIGGITVSQQEFGLVNKAAWASGDGISNGIIGFAFPSITDAFKGNDPNKDTDANREPYLPWFFSAVAQGKASRPIFSLAMNRGSVATESSGGHDSNLGYLALGGLAPVEVTNNSTTVPIQGFASTNGPSSLVYYSLDVQRYVFPGTANGNTSGQTIIDSGTTLNYVPTNIAAAYNSKIVPPAVVDADYGIYIVACNATAPPFTAVIGGASFTVDGRDQIVPLGLDGEGNQVCASGTQDGGPRGPDAIFVFGDVFLHNVVVAFDIGANTTTIVQRASY